MFVIITNLPRNILFLNVIIDLFCERMSFRSVDFCLVIVIVVASVVTGIE